MDDTPVTDIPPPATPGNSSGHPHQSGSTANRTPSTVPNNPTTTCPPKPHENLASRTDISLAELITLMDEYPPLVPDAVTDYYLAKAGFDCDDVRIKRVIGLAAQKFIADVANDALHFSRLRQQPPQTHARKGPKKLVLNLEDLSAALSEYGINVKRPDYYT